MDRQFGKRQWSVNGRFLSRDPTGVDRYAFEILKAMDSLITEGHPLARGLQIELLCPAGGVNSSPFQTIPLRLLPKAPGHVWEQCILPMYVRGGLVSLCNTGPLAIERQIVCIHDVNTRLAPASYSAAFRTIYRILEPALGRRAQQITTVSRFSKDMLKQFGVVSGRKITVIYDGHEHVFRWDASKSAMRDLDLRRPYVLAVGSKALHKNLEIVYSAAIDLAAKDIQVFMTGGHNFDVFARGLEFVVPPNVRHLGRVNDDDLAFLYGHALCLVFPSKTEGFGLPAAEAMALGCPVISSDAASLPEVCGSAAIYAKPDAPESWVDGICKLANSASLRKQLIGAGRERVKMFSWRAGAAKYLELMYAIDSQS